MSQVSRPTPLRFDDLAGILAGCDANLIGPGDTIVSSITEDSRRVTPGSLFVVRRGERSDGARFIPQALARGASALLCAAGAGVDTTPRIEVADLRKAWGICAHALYGDPSLALSVVGITGTNGKTTVACLVEQALRALGISAGRLGTLGFFLDGKKLEDSLTTPQPDQLAHSFARVRDAGGQALVMEVSSHALDQQRTAGVQFSVAAFTNLSQDHLDYHGTMAEYGRAKARLFREGAPGARVINVDDGFGRQLALEFPDAVTVSANGAPATLGAQNARFHRQGLSATIDFGGLSFALTSPLLGRHNLENLLVSWGILASLGHEAEAIVEVLGGAVGVPGRLERCDAPEDDIVVVVDYAHTPDALKRALVTLVDLDFEETICVFGCGGDRDRTKRPLMGEAVARHADRIVVTSDNPRTEDPAAILADIRPGLGNARGAPVEELDRRTAIESAILDASPGSVVLIAGKGHEDYQLIGDEVLHFDDREEARRALSLRRSKGGR